MFEITMNDQVLFAKYQKERKAYHDGVYDFTFDNKFLIYHVNLTHENTYIAINIKDGKGVRIIATKDKIYRPNEYKKLIPYVLDSLKYTGERKYLSPCSTDSKNMIDFIFRQILSKYGYTVREEQIKLSQSIYEGLTNNKIAICEAEVGTGKTLAYLVAGIAAREIFNMYSRGHNPPVTITTSSIELQNALINKEIPFLSEALMTYKIIDKPLSAVLRKGKEHYFCPRRFLDFYGSISKYPDKYSKLISYFEKSKFVSNAFDLDKYSLSSSLKERICVKGSCYHCPLQNHCKYNSFVKDSMDSCYYYDFQITNHNLFLTANIHDHILRNSSYLIIDEAHKLNEAARDIYGEELNETTIEKYLRFSKTCCANANNQAVYKQTSEKISRLNRILFSSLKKKQKESDEEIDNNNLISLSSKELLAIDGLIENIELLESLKSKTKGTVLVNGKQLVDTLFSFLRPSDIFIWNKIEIDGTTTLCNAETNIGLNLCKDVWKKSAGYALLSGTMSNGLNFDFFKKEVGVNRISEKRITESYTKSPFDYKNHTRMYIPNDLPAPSNNCSNEYIEAISDRIVELINATNGHTAILFTSYKALYLVYEKTKERLKKYDLFCMSKTNKNVIRDFKASKNGVIFASGSMWEGVDCQGDMLSSVIIVRLPFPQKSTLVELKKNEYKNTGEFIDQYVVPTMLIKLRQGMGRLIRDENDTGLISILDTRARRRYTEDVKNVTSRFPQIESIDEIKEFFREVKAESYFEN